MQRILLIENNAKDRDWIATLLDIQPEWHLEFAETHQQAFDWVQLALPDMIVTALQPPYVDGVEIVKEVRRRQARIPIVLITAQGCEKMAVEALKLGATSFSPRARLEQDLVQTIRHVFDVSQHMAYTHDTSKLPAPQQAAFVLENDLNLIGPLIEHLQNNLPSWSESDRLQIGMAMDEALLNAMHHGNLEVDSSLRDEDYDRYYKAVRERNCQPPFCDRRVRLEAEFSDQHICVQISDEGPGFDPQSIPDPRSQENLHKVSGRGLFLIRSFMDHVTHNRNGNQITMTKLRRN